MIAVLISIRPKWCEKIISGEKTIEVRKTRPKMDTPFKCYIYCTLPKYPHEDFIATDYPRPQFYGGGKVIGEFTCNRVTNLFQTAGFGWTRMMFYTRVCLLRKCENTQMVRVDYTAGTSQICAFTITRAICGSLSACGRRDSAGSQCQSPARRRAGGMWRKRHEKTNV